MELIEAGSLTALGTSAHLLLPEPASRIGDGTRPAPPPATAEHQKEPTLDELWKRVVAAFDAAVEAAREDREAAKKLYDFALYGLGNRGTGHGIREAFTELKIPLDFLSHKDDQRLSA
ncbi:hypothetical protein [Arthrobacter sp. H5]|uniref:hypothetical protein n=1 Tax=Arthrobacter sp. H5 TaxID=1267973 RepID=UPI0004B7D9FD|nr:hypothetical protein [Arthrobacter sp. H5]